MKIKNISFFLRRLLTDIQENKNISLCDDLNSPQLGYYYFKFQEDGINSRGGNKPFQFDADGIPLIHSYIDVVDNKGYYYYPITIGQYGLAVFHTWLNKGKEEDKQHFLRIADWFMKNRITDPELGVYWLTDVPKPEYHVHSAWKSAFTQSRGISILLRAWQLTEDQQYMDAAGQALIPFTKDIAEGGVAVDRKKQETFYEEYVATVPTRVLDGHIFSLFGLYDFVRATSNETESSTYQLASKLFKEGIDGLIKQLPQYDMGFWLRFNRCELPGYPQNDPCTIGYLRLVSTQLAVLYRITQKEELLLFSRKCKKYDRFINIIKMYRRKFTALKKLNRL